MGWVFLSLCALGVVALVLPVGLGLVLGPRQDAVDRCSSRAPAGLTDDQVAFAGSENLLTSTLRCTWPSVDGKRVTTVTISAY